MIWVACGDNSSRPGCGDGCRAYAHFEHISIAILYSNWYAARVIIIMELFHVIAHAITGPRNWSASCSRARHNWSAQSSAVDAVVALIFSKEDGGDVQKKWTARRQGGKCNPPILCNVPFFKIFLSSEIVQKTSARKLQQKNSQKNFFLTFFF